VNVLVTGGAGYVGSPLIRLLLANDFNVIVIDNLTFGGEALLGVWNNPAFKFIKGDIISNGVLKNLFNDYKIDAVIHLAAIVGDPACEKNPDLARKVNWDASINVLNFSIKNKVNRFIFASTCSNYGKMPDSEAYVDETSTLAPVSLYAELKVKFEDVILNRIDKKDGFYPTSLRFATVYGISPRMRFDLTVNEFTKELVLGRELEVFDQQFWRPYCHVFDFSRVMLQVLTSDEEKVAYKVFNAGDTNENYTKKMIIDEIMKFVPEAKVKYVKKDEDPRNYKVSFEKIRNVLGFSINKRVKDGIHEIISSIKQNIFLNPDDLKYRNA